MKKKLYISPVLKIHIMKGNRLMLNYSDTPIDDGFVDSAKEGFFDENDNILPRGKNVWADDF